MKPPNALVIYQDFRGSGGLELAEYHDEFLSIRSDGSIDCSNGFPNRRWLNENKTKLNAANAQTLDRLLRYYKL